jgi:hypothetical protein
VNTVLGEDVMLGPRNSEWRGIDFLYRKAITEFPSYDRDVPLDSSKRKNSASTLPKWDGLQ